MEKMQWRVKDKSDNIKKFENELCASLPKGSTGDVMPVQIEKIYDISLLGSYGNNNGLGTVGEKWNEIVRGKIVAFKEKFEGHISKMNSSLNVPSSFGGDKGVRIDGSGRSP